MTRLAELSQLERAVVIRWRQEMPDGRHGRCDGCGRTHDEEGKPLFVRRRLRGRTWLCLRCFDERPG